MAAEKTKGGNDSEPVRVASVKDIPEDRPFCAKAAGKKIVIAKVGGRYYAHLNECTHAGGPLCEGSIQDGTLVCPWHGSTFRIDTGAVVSGPAKEGLVSLPVEVRGEDLYVRLAAPK